MARARTTPSTRIEPDTPIFSSSHFDDCGEPCDLRRRQSMFLCGDARHAQRWIFPRSSFCSPAHLTTPWDASGCPTPTPTPAETKAQLARKARILARRQGRADEEGGLQGSDSGGDSSDVSDGEGMRWRILRRRGIRSESRYVSRGPRGLGIGGGPKSRIARGDDRRRGKAA